jgi:mRNA-degrading endonuclease RelE of RelBE toxin-antitoxin system
MDRIHKFLRKLTPKKKAKVQDAANAILQNDIAELDIKPLKGRKGYYRCRLDDIRIVFCRNKNGKDAIVDMDYRSRIYRKWR